MQRFENRQALALDDDFALPAVEIRADKLGIALVVAEVVEGIAVGARNFGFDIETRRGASLGQFGGGVALRNIGQVALAQVVLPGLVKIGEGLAGGQLEDLGEGLGSPPVGEELLEDIGAVAVGHKVADRLAFLVHLVGAVYIVHLLDRRQTPRKERVADDHIAEAGPLARPVFGQALGKPQWRRAKVENFVALERAGNDVEGEDVDQFVVQYPLEVGVRAAQGHRHPAFEILSKTGHALGQ